MMSNIPKGYKNTELGLIPDDWEVKKVGEICDFIVPGRNKPKKFEGSIPWITTPDIEGNTVTVSKYGLFITKEEAKNVGSKIVKKDSVIISCVGNLGLVTIAGVDIVINQQLHAFLPNESIDSYFLCYALIRQKSYMESVATKTAVPYMNKDNCNSIPLPVPTLEEQKAIANTLSDIDTLITNIETLINKKRNIKQGAMQKLLQPKEGWEVKKLFYIGDIITGSTPPTQIKKYWNGDIPWITPTDISNNKKNIYHSEREISNQGLSVIRKLPKNTLLVTCIASIGKNAILKSIGSCNQQINAITPNKDYCVDFLYYLIENNKQYLLGKAGITATLIISKKDFSEITFSFPPTKEEQIHISTILSDMDSEITFLETKLEKYKNIKLGMMQNLLTGKIRLI